MSKLACKIIEFPSKKSQPIAVPRDIQLGDLLDAIEKRHPHMRVAGQTIDESFTFWLTLLSDKRIAMSLLRMAAGASRTGEGVPSAVAELLEDFISCIDVSEKSR